MLPKGNDNKGTLNSSLECYVRLPYNISELSTFLQMGKDIKVFSADSVEHDTESSDSYLIGNEPS
jgi:hypothetical protein